MYVTAAVFLVIFVLNLLSNLRRIHFFQAHRAASRRKHG
jgi:hypothetical protein